MVFYLYFVVDLYSTYMTVSHFLGSKKTPCQKTKEVCISYTSSPVKTKTSLNDQSNHSLQCATEQPTPEYDKTNIIHMTLFFVYMCRSSDKTLSQAVFHGLQSSAVNCSN